MERVHRTKPSSRDLANLRRSLLNEVNKASTELLSQAMEAVRGLRDATFNVELRQADGSFAPTLTPAHDVPPFADAEPVLALAQLVQQLPLHAQASVPAGLELQMTGEMRRADLRLAKMTGGSVGVSAEEMALNKHIDQQRAYESSAPAEALDFLSRHRQEVWPFAWGTWAIPYLLSANASDNELIEAATQYEQLRRAMYRPMPISSSASYAKQRRDTIAWSSYEACGDAFGLLGVWLRAIAATGTTRRCQICYRHLGPGLKRYCPQHIRTALARQARRDLHISSVYGPLVEARAREQLAATPAARAWILSEDGLADLVVEAQAAGIRQELARPAAALAATLRALYPSMTQPVIEHVQSLFVQLFTLAQEPFEWSAPQSFEEHARRLRALREAPHLLRLDVFFKALFGQLEDLSRDSGRKLGIGLDPQHPNAIGQSVSLQRIAVDLLHVSTWLDVDAVFDKFAYVDPLSLRRLRVGDPSVGTQPMSLSQIGKAVGISHEAVRQTLRHADGLAGLADRRLRIIPGGLQALREHLSAQDRAAMRRAIKT